MKDLRWNLFQAIVHASFLKVKSRKDFNILICLLKLSVLFKILYSLGREF